MKQHKIWTCLSQKPSNQRPLYCTDTSVTKPLQRLAVYIIFSTSALAYIAYVVWFNVRSRCLFVTLYCCIVDNVITDCNGQAFVSAIKLQTSFCSHGPTCVYSSSVGLHTHENHICPYVSVLCGLTRLKAACMNVYVYVYIYIYIYICKKKVAGVSNLSGHCN